MKTGANMHAIKRIAIFFCVSMLMVFVSTTVNAATYPWKIPSNVRVVQKSDTDNVRIFGTITAALSSITNASETNPYVVKVMPGIYNETVTMKPYVDVVGSGQENTKITSGSVGYADRCASKGTVVMASNSRIENIMVENTNGDNCPVAINITDKTNVIIDRVMAETKGSGDFTNTPSPAGSAILITGSLSGNLTIRNTTAIISSVVNGAATPDFGGIMHYHNGMTDVAVINIDNVVAQCKVQQANYCAGIALWGDGGTYNINNSTFKASGGITAVGIDTGFGSSTGHANFSKIISTADSGTRSFGIQVESGDCTVNNSEISGATYALRRSATPIKIGNSLIGGGTSGLVAGEDKVVNCYNGDYNPIPNL